MRPQLVKMNKYDWQGKVFCGLLSGVFLFLFCLVLKPVFTQNAEKSSKPFENYNVVLIYLDTLRADHLSCYGYFRKTSPHIDQLATESTIFEQNFAPVSFTISSFTSIISSLYPGSHGVFHICKDKLSPRVNTLAQILKSYGYQTAWFGPLRDSHLDPEVGFGRGFDELAGFENEFVLEKVKNAFCSWLDAHKDKKFFLNFHTYKMHAPYLPSPKYKGKFTEIKSMKGVIEDIDEYYRGSIKQIMKDKRLAIEIMGQDLYNEFMAAGLILGDIEQMEEFFVSRGKRDKLSGIRSFVYWSGLHLGEKAVNSYVQALYDADIREYDSEVIGPVIKKLKALNLYDKTIIIICSDHGEEFYEHGGFSHGKTLYDEVTRVPWLIRVPWVKQAKRVKEFTQTVDIMPTLLDLLKIPIPHQAQGESLAGFINGQGPLPLREYVFGRIMDKSSIRSKEWLLVLEDNELDPKQLYDLRADPGQQNNVYSKHQDIALELEFKLREWEKSLPSYRDQEYSFSPEIDKITQERIRKTGYW